jgi:biopolymer transport protein ExbB
MGRKWKILLVTFVVMLSVAPFAMAQDGGRPQVQSFWWIVKTAWFNDFISFIDITLIFLASIGSIALIIEHALTIRRTTMLPDMSVATIKTMFDERRFREALEYCQEDPSFVASVVHAGLIEAANGYHAMEKAMGDAAEERTARLFRKIEYLNLLGNISPMLGLFGTVYGMMDAFRTLSTMSNPDPSALAGGIMVALFSTFLGLAAAIPALTGYAIFKNRIDHLSIESALMAEELLANFKPQKAAKQA